MPADTTAPVAPELWPVGKWTTNPRVTFSTTLGNVVVELQPNAATYSVVNFLAYVNTGFYKNLLIHRVIPEFVIQGGGFAKGLVHKPPYYSPIALESDNGLSNSRGTLAMARTSDPNSATSQFYINLVNNTSLNYDGARNPGYAVFGKVVAGMPVVDKIARVATNDRSGLSDVPVKDVVIKTATETTTGTVHDKSGLVTVGGVESGARWDYSMDGGRNWTRGTSNLRFTLAQGGYEANAVVVRQTDAAGNVSMVGKAGASIVVHAGAAICGNASANVLNGTSKNDAMFGLAGNDTLNGAAGHDTLDGGSGNDLMVGGAGNDMYFVRNAADIVRESGSGGGIDTVRSYLSSHTLASHIEKGQIMLTGRADLTGNGLDNLLYAGVGGNTINGGAGTDTVSYANGVDGDNGVEVSLATTALQSTNGSGSDALIGVENLIGSPYADHLAGNALNNILTGAAGQDTLTGGGGNDVFDFNALAEMGRTDTTCDIITDFDLGDLLDLSTLDANTTTAANDVFSATLVDLFTAPGQLLFDNGILYGNTDGNAATAEFLIMLSGVTSLTANEVIL